MFYFCGLQAIIDDKTLNFVFKSFFTFWVKMHPDCVSGVPDFFLKGLWSFLCYDFLCHFFTPPFRTQKGQIQTICLYLPCRCPYSVMINRTVALYCLHILSMSPSQSEIFLSRLCSTVLSVRSVSSIWSSSLRL